MHCRLFDKGIPFKLLFQQIPVLVNIRGNTMQERRDGPVVFDGESVVAADSAHM
ncbi:hypothetical protein [Pseudovibrio sp. W64]|uniref:hypothetical protein n=1 Tax=Pseudovibrio sp. W64 TaxID=1735583 RepID=UPI000ADF36C5|nr:hypothetical protein [Pseudovibrio sp. W64]